MQLIVGHDIAVAGWVAQKLGGPTAHFVPPYHAAGIIDKGGILRGGIVVRPTNAATCDLSVFSDKVLTHGIARETFRTIFDRLGFARCVVYIRDTNKMMKRCIPKMGFKFECKAQNYYGPGEDALQFSMTRSTCRWVS